MVDTTKRSQINKSDHSKTVHTKTLDWHLNTNNGHLVYTYIKKMPRKYA